LRRILLAATLLAVASLPSLAQVPQRSGKWTINSNASGPGCQVTVNNLVRGGNPDEMFLMMLSYYAEYRSFVMVLGSKSWNYFTTDKNYDIALRFDGSPPLVLPMVALHSSRLVLDGIDGPALFEKLAGARSLAVGQGDRIFVTLLIDGGAQAMAALRDCQARHEGSGKPRAATQPPQATPPAAQSPSSPSAGARRVWKELGNWRVSFVDGFDGCSIFTAGDEITLDISWLRNGFLMIARNAAWTQFTPEKSHDVTLRFHPGGAYQTRPRADRLRDMPLLGWVEVEPEFFEDFARASRLTVEYQGSVIGSIDLAGSTAALREKEACDRTWPARKPPPLLRPAAPPPQAAPPAPSLLPPSSGPAREAPPPSETSPQR